MDCCIGVKNCLAVMFVIPLTRHNSELHMPHDKSHQAMRKTHDRKRASLLTWPNLSNDCRYYASHCQECQLKARVTCYYGVPIKAVERAQELFQYWFMDFAGPLIPNSAANINYCLTLWSTRIPYIRWPYR